MVVIMILISYISTLSQGIHLHIIGSKDNVNHRKWYEIKLIEIVYILMSIGYIQSFYPIPIWKSRDKPNITISSH